jgi:hypothetical protein
LAELEEGVQYLIRELREFRTKGLRLGLRLRIRNPSTDVTLFNALIKCPSHTF